MKLNFTKDMKLLQVDEKTRAQEKHRHRFTWHSFRMVYRDVKIPWGKYILAAVLAAVFFGISGSSASFAAKIAAGDFSDLGMVLMYVAASILALGVCIPLILMNYANAEVCTHVKVKLFKKVLKLPQSYFDRESPNRILSRITSDSENSMAPFGYALVMISLVATAGGVIFTSDGALSTPMTRWLLIGTLLMFAIIMVSVVLITWTGFIGTNRLSAFTAYLSERLANFKLIKAARSEEQEEETAHRLIKNRAKAYATQIVAQIVYQAGVSVLMLFTYIGCFLFGWVLYRDGIVTEGQAFVKFYNYGAGIITLVQTAGILIAAFGLAAGGSSEFTAILDEEEENTQEGGKMPVEPQDILLKNLNFSYDGLISVLQDLSCRIEKGKVTAIVGSNGSGKSTLTKLIERLYTGADDTVFLGDTPAENISLRSWRNRVGAVLQNASLFSGSIRSNICYGMSDISEEELLAVCKLSGLDQVLMAHEEGLDYDVGISGCRLSGGEQQRVAIARAMIKNPDILILDEATANLDVKTEREIQKGIHALMKGRTVIIVAHNYETIKEADQVIVLNEGRVACSGRHEALMESSAFYRALASANFGA